VVDAPGLKSNFSNKCSSIPKIITKVETSIRRYRGLELDIHRWKSYRSFIETFCAKP
jgi:hypothetical protein